MTQIFKIYLTAATVASILVQCYCEYLPSDLEKCKVEDNECIRNKIMEIVKKYPKGNPKIGLPNMSELQMNNLTISRANGNSTLQLNLKFSKLTTYGIENVLIEHTSGWTKDVKNIEIEAKIPWLKQVGDYETNGKVLLFNLESKGRGNFEMTDCKAHFKVQLKLEKREDGKNYAKLTKLKITVKPERLSIRMENLVKDSKELTDAINAVLNDNWRDLWNELSDGINNALSEAYMNILTSVLNKIPYDDFYAE
ncbi:protein takeout-like isoform X5 [Haematobia irritans]|uniref:protein takeout-like isoform X5 n=1 Tax=Haematobia irritans TaxID=7368 RepID=UPI003F4F7394